MIEYEKKIAQQTLDILKKKSWSALSLDQALKNNKMNTLILIQNLICLKILIDTLIIC